MLPLSVKSGEYTFEIYVAADSFDGSYETGKFNTDLIDSECDAALRFVVWKDNMIYDVKEQNVCLVPKQYREHPHLSEYILGWALAVIEVLEALDDAWGLLPSDLIKHDVLKLKTPETADAFKDALLVKSRLGKFIRS